MKNYDPRTVRDFGDEWSRFSQEKLTDQELKQQFDRYFAIFDWEALPRDAEGFDMGCGSGRWAKLVAPRVARLHCIDASPAALEVARRNLSENSNCQFHQALFENIPLDDDSMDFGYSLGVLHHIPDSLAGISSCVGKIKSGAPFLAYLYYAFDNKPFWFRMIWICSDALRKTVSRLPFRLKLFVSQIIAGVIYYPLARLSLILEKIGLEVGNIPLSAYRDLPFYSMRTDALDRFGTRLENRFTKEEIVEMFEKSGLEKIVVSESVPFWCVLGYKKHT